MPTYTFFFFFKKSTFCAGIKLFSSVTILKNDKTKFKAALRKYLRTHCVYCVDVLCCLWVEMVCSTVL